VLLLSLFAPWYTVDHASVSRTPTGFFLRFGSNTTDAWNAVIGTSVVVAVCAVGIVTVGGLLYFGRPRAISVAIALAIVALGVAGYRALEPPTHRVTIGEAGYFSRSNGVTVGHERSEPLETHWGGWAALGASLAAAAAAAATFAVHRRRVF
jgi:hypothetical protein